VVCTHPTFIQNLLCRAREMSQQLRSLDLARGPESGFHTHRLQLPATPAPRKLIPSSGFHGHPLKHTRAQAHAYVCVRTHTHTHTLMHTHRGKEITKSIFKKIMYLECRPPYLCTMCVCVCVCEVPTEAKRGCQAP
jgi:hypothetical protein